MHYEIEKSKTMYEKSKEYVFEATKFLDAILEHGDGCYVWDVDGNKYLDLNSGQFCLSFGHNDPELQEVILNQLKKIYHTNTATLTPQVLKACADMAEITGGSLKKTIFLSTGSEANECAIRYARFITQKTSVLSFSQGYHGLTLGSQQSTMGGVWARPKSAVNYSIDCFATTEDLEEFFKTVINESNGDIAAVIVEPVLAVGGILIPKKELFIKLRELCDKYDILLIFDECQTGFGRTGKWFCYQHFGIEPDILTCAKAMGLGIAVASVTFKTEIAKKIEGKIVHFSSHQNDPLSCAITSYVIDRIKRDNLLENIKTIGAYLYSELLKLSKEIDFISGVRGLGMLYGFDIPQEISKTFLYELQKRGVLLQAIRQGRTCRLSPCYTITKDDIDFLINKIREVGKTILLDKDVS